MSGRAILLEVEARRPASWLLLLAALGGASVAGSGRVEGMPPAAVSARREHLGHLLAGPDWILNKTSLSERSI